MLKSESEVTQSCPTLCDPMGCGLPGFSVHGIFQARVLEWGAIARRSISKMGEIWKRSVDRISVKILVVILYHSFRLPRWLSGKESTCRAGDEGSIPGSGRAPGEGKSNPLHSESSFLGFQVTSSSSWERKYQPTPIFLSGKSFAQKNLTHYSPWDHKESDVT